MKNKNDGGGSTIYTNFALTLAHHINPRSEPTPLSTRLFRMSQFPCPGPGMTKFCLPQVLGNRGVRFVSRIVLGNVELELITGLSARPNQAR